MQSYFGFTLPDTLESYFMNYSDEGDARRAYEEQCPTWKPSDHRFGAVLVKTEYESDWDADKARLDFLEAEAGSGRGIPAGEGTVRERIDRVRGVPEQKKTILMTPSDVKPKPAAKVSKFNDRHRDVLRALVEATLQNGICSFPYTYLAEKTGIPANDIYDSNTEKGLCADLEEMCVLSVSRDSCVVPEGYLEIAMTRAKYW